MRICILAKDAAINGGNRVALALVRHLSAAGHAVELCLSQHREDRSFALGDVEVVDPPAALQSEYDCAICTYFSEAETFRDLRARKKIRYVQADYWKNGEESAIRMKNADKYFEESNACTIAVSSYVHDVLKSRGIAAHIVRPTIEQHDFNFEPDLRDGAFRILVEGTDNRWKRLRESRDAIPRDIETWCLSPSQVSVQADRNWVCQEQTMIPKIMSACALIVKLSEMEGYPLILLESMKCGVIPIVLNRGGQVDYCVDGENAFLVSSAGEVPGTIRRYLALCPEDQAMLAENAKATARSRSWHQMTADFLRIIETGRL